MTETQCKMCPLNKITNHADGLKDIGAAPDGLANTFCDPVYTTSNPEKVLLFIARYIFKGTPLLNRSPNKKSITTFLLLTFK